MENYTQPQSDHDTLIEIRTLVGELKKEVRELKDGTHSQLNEHEGRIRALEDAAIRIQPDRRMARYDKTVTEWDEFKTRLKIYIGLIVSLAGFLGALLNQVLRIWLESHIGK